MKLGGKEGDSVCEYLSFRRLISQRADLAMTADSAEIMVSFISNSAVNLVGFQSPQSSSDCWNILALFHENSELCGSE